MVGHITSLVQGTQLFGVLPGSERSCQFRMLPTGHIQRVDNLWQTQPRKTHRCQQCELAPGGGHALKRVIRGGCMGPCCGHPAKAVC